MFLPCRALNDDRFFFILSDSPALGLPAVFAPCSPNRMVFTWLPSLATTTCDLVGWFGVRLGLLYPDTPARASRGSFCVDFFFAAMLYDITKGESDATSNSFSGNWNTNYIHWYLGATRIVMWWAGVVEATGNAAVVSVLGWRMGSTWKSRWWSLLAFQVSATIWFASNVGYAFMFIGSETGRWIWWDTWFEQTSETLQQLAIMLLPLTVFNLVGQLVKDYWATARRLEGGK